MTREVTHVADGPAKLDADDMGDDGMIYVCRCGLSDDQPLCDGSHNATADEADGVRYKYDDGSRRVIEEIVCADDTE